jgi:hypothetical protein
MILTNKELCFGQAINHFNNPKKISAIVEIAQILKHTPIQSIREKIGEHGISYLQTFPFIGPVTAYHLAKNIGFPLAKADRHLKRISDLLGYQNPMVLCNEISKNIDESISVVDLVIWRYATIDKDYLQNLSRLVKNK